MKTIAILYCISLLSSTFMTTQVYICGPKGAKKYHLTASCRGLSSCKDATVKVSLSQAENFGLSLCGWED
ncbi:hypothetical protein [Flavobacterium sp. RSSB_23]|uniref:hypothetical protein n=1 Tax=Flavobacterium sp. RSSB_23 TaxID=3447668 RepID=UPI003F36C052